MSAHDRYALALAVLDGDRESRKILADLLEEQGDRRLAHWARKGAGTRQRRLEFTLMLLPCREAILLAADCLKESSFRRFGNVAADRLVETVRRWHRGAVADEQIAEICGKLLPHLQRIAPNPYVLSNRNDSFPSDSGAAALVEAIRLTVESRSDRDRQSRVKSRPYEYDILLLVRRILTTTRRFGFPPMTAPEGSIKYLDATDWQIEKVKAAFKTLLTPEVASWPK
jgi:hypothetical protein